MALETVLEHAEGLVCLSGCALRGVHDEPTLRRLREAFGPERLRVELQRPFLRDDRARNRRLVALARRLGLACVATGNVHAHARSRAPLQDALVGRAQAHDARRLRARAAGELQPRARFARRRWRPALPSIPRRWQRPRAWPRCCASICAAISATATRAPRTRRRCASSQSSATPACASATRTRRPGSASARTGRLEEEQRIIAALKLPGFFLLHHDMLELAREVAVEVRGPDTARALLPAGAGAGLERLLDRLLPDRALARRPDRQRAPDRALPQRGTDLAARHRPRLSPRHPRAADPPRARALWPRPLGAGGGLPHVSRARSDPRARQGAGTAARRDRAGGARQRGLGRARGGQGHREHRTPGAAGALGVAGPAGRRGARAAAPSVPALGRDDRRHPAADRLLPDRARGDGRAGRSSSGTRTPAPTPAFSRSTCSGWGCSRRSSGASS